MAESPPARTRLIGDGGDPATAVVSPDKTDLDAEVDWLETTPTESRRERACPVRSSLRATMARRPDDAANRGRNQTVTLSSRPTRANTERYAVAHGGFERRSDIVAVVPKRPDPLLQSSSPSGPSAMSGGVATSNAPAGRSGRVAVDLYRFSRGPPPGRRDACGPHRTVRGRVRDKGSADEHPVVSVRYCIAIRPRHDRSKP